jgi:hypothetical protein
MMAEGRVEVRRYVPVCVRRKLGFSAGPVAYVESDACPCPIVLDVRAITEDGGAMRRGDCFVT